ncbi:f7effc1a-0c1b-4116-b82b-9f1fa865868d-CDS [Sclerotinia trifoliorum]|uniref:F7effc1a-0c1b-4116-b82b-9f1fa865868d-CDS n=1 Tax=Sclerotinia trifoliorum TaxID=28548 RepID=A0A8H2ZT03_9HELO|nr:f7effc1a-0c1b-4116-b82b-9f1fa865868d-CDS [Sclerotinia trifoliorum]
MPPYVPSEKAYLLHLCAVHGITGDQIAPNGSWQRLVQDMVAEAPRHLEGGDLFNDEPWPVRQYTWGKIPFNCRRWLKVGRAQMRDAHAIAGENDVDIRMTLGFILNEQQ